MTHVQSRPVGKRIGGLALMLVAVAMISVGLTIRNRRRKQHAVLSGPPAAPARPRLDPLDTIARRARLRDSGAITEAEFEREKARLLDQI